MNNSQTFNLGKPTKRGIRKCKKCGVYNGTKSIFCKNKDCDMMFKDYSEKKELTLSAVRLITLNIRRLYSVRISEQGSDQRGFVQLPIIPSLNMNNNSQFTEMALCFVDSCPKLHNSFSSSFPSCQHIIASGKSHNVATPLPIKLNSILKLKISKQIQEKLWILNNENDIPLVQKVSKNVMVIRCQVTPKHPLGYLHFSISRDLRDKKFGTYFCDCSKTVEIPKCIHYYLCICALASDPKCALEFKTFISTEMEDGTTNELTITNFKFGCSRTNTAKSKLKSSFAESDLKQNENKRKNKGGSIQRTIQRKISPKIYPIQINILDNKEANQNDNNPFWTFDNWLSFIVESMNKLMTFENAGSTNTLVYNIPWSFYQAFRSRVPQMYLSQYQSILDYELFNIMNISHVKEIFLNSKVKLKVSKRFVLSESSEYKEIDESEELSGEIMSHFIYFLNVGQLTVDDSDNTNNSFIIEWIYNFGNIGVGQLKFQYKYGRKCL